MTDWVMQRDPGESDADYVRRLALFRDVRIVVRPECLPDSVMERIQAIADAHPAADVTLVGGLAKDMEP